MDSISLSASARSSLLALRQISDQMSSVQNHLATGRRVSNPFDDPAAYFTAASLNTRASALDALDAGITAAQKTLDTANQGIQAIRSLLTAAQSLATQALQSPNTLVKVTGSNASALTTASVISSSSGSTTKFKSGDTVTVSDGTVTATYTAGSNDTVQSFLNAVNNTAGLKATASLNSSGQIQIQATGATGLTIGGTLAGSGTLNGVIGLTAGTTAFVANTTRQSQALQFDAIRAQIDQAAQDASYNGQNLLNGSTLSVNLNETGTSKLTIAGAQLSANGLGVTASGNQFQTDADVNAALASITSALAALQAQSSQFGANASVVSGRQAFNNGLAQTLRSGADDLTAADPNQESALLMNLQTRQQLAVTALGLSRQSDQAILRLFGL